MKKKMCLVVFLSIAVVGLSWLSAIPAGNYGWALPALDSPYYRYGTGYPYSYTYGSVYTVAPSVYSYPVSRATYSYAVTPSIYTVPVRAAYPAVVTTIPTYPVGVVRYPAVYYTPVVYSPWVPISYYPWGTYYPTLYGW